MSRACEVVAESAAYRKQQRTAGTGRAAHNSLAGRTQGDVCKQHTAAAMEGAEVSNQLEPHLGDDAFVGQPHLRLHHSAQEGLRERVASEPSCV